MGKFYIGSEEVLGYRGITQSRNEEGMDCTNRESSCMEQRGEGLDLGRVREKGGGEPFWGQPEGELKVRFRARQGDEG
jgi:hypothetical protein